MVSYLIEEQKGKDESFVHDIRGISRLLKSLLSARKREAVREGDEWVDEEERVQGG